MYTDIDRYIEATASVLAQSVTAQGASCRRHHHLRRVCLLVRITDMIIG